MRIFTPTILQQKWTGAKCCTLAVKLSLFGKETQVFFWTFAWVLFVFQYFHQEYLLVRLTCPESLTLSLYHHNFGTLSLQAEHAPRPRLPMGVPEASGSTDIKGLSFLLTKIKLEVNNDLEQFPLEYGKLLVGYGWLWIPMGDLMGVLMLLISDVLFTWPGLQC